ncbi:hypothetical protein [Haloarcula laminariae]|uniref:hypothetical protein n=1 Tax=Haloarcula laminariae TaxID=2961577 RepID=UPI0021C596C6|nr:hypothetical protein [Halomicroarcula laminariae]
MNCTVPSDALLDTAVEREAWMLGADTATELLERRGTSDPTTLTARLNIRVETEDWDGTGTLVMLGSYDGDVISLYREQIRALAERHDIPTAHLTAGVLAHELGHAVVPDDKLASIHPGSWRRRIGDLFGISSHAKPIAEAAANGFAFAVLRSEYPETPLVERPRVLTNPGMTAVDSASSPESHH